jgi:hypothetical protein
MKHLICVMLFIINSGCAYYPDLDYVNYYAVDYGNRVGSKDKVFYRESGRGTSNLDKIIAFSIGAKKLKEYHNDRAKASESITSEIFKEKGFCAKGYQIKYDPLITQGDMGFGWKVFCD